eukprot:TRINITY_DN31131_c0_g1_i1.p2 TRINITY_DN31131_c0_g1~~TRINITY_DN31131_c0_g1_i1.p2  ORF type:complete len:163 (-),score=59.32 TRINITY_DN31131_c0_g1_i1:45-533(-)
MKPQVVWAQRKTFVIATIQATTPNPEVTISEDKVTYKCGDDAVEIELCHKIDVSQSRYSVHRHVELHLQKTDDTWWPRLTAAKKVAGVKVDWTKWQDEDEEAEEAASKQEEMSNLLQGMAGGGGGMANGLNMDDLMQKAKGAAPQPAAVDSDSDDEDLPELE